MSSRALTNNEPWPNHWASAYVWARRLGVREGFVAGATAHKLVAGNVLERSLGGSLFRLREHVTLEQARDIVTVMLA